MSSQDVTLDADSKHFLDIFNERAKKELGGKKLSDLPIDEARQIIAKLLAPDEDTNRVPLPELDVAVADASLKYTHHNETIELAYKIYTPREHDHKLPVVMYFHGGGFALGDNGLIDFGCKYLAQHLPSRVVSVEYRKSPEFTFPVAHHDAYFASLYVAEHPDEFKSNGTIAVAGDSAGGNLAASVAIMARESRALTIAFQFLIYPWVNLNNNSESDRKLAHGYYLELDTLNWMADMYVTTANDKNNPLASPLLRNDLSNLPSAYIVIGTADPIHDDAKAYAEKLKQAGNKVEFEELPGILHDYCALPHFFRATQATFAKAVEKMKKYLPT